VAKLARHDRWLIASQDCDLARLDSGNNDSRVELRPVFERTVAAPWGVKSRLFRLRDMLHLESASPRVMISGQALERFAGNRESPLPDGRLRALKRWLGLRYDRPAVPPALEGLAKKISEALSASSEEVVNHVHDVLMQFDTSPVPPTYSLFAIIDDTADEETVRRWLASCAGKVPSTLGGAIRLEAGTKDRTPIRLLEDSYSANVSDVTWEGQEPEGAV
jgi:hypothetical protein